MPTKPNLLTDEEADLVIGAIPLQVLPREGEKWYVGDCRKCHAIVVDCCDQCERCRDCCNCYGRITNTE